MKTAGLLALGFVLGVSAVVGGVIIYDALDAGKPE